MECHQSDDPVLEASLTELLNVEGGFSNHKFDPGSKTRFGVTIAVARAFGYTGPMRTLPKATAREIYRRKYWQPSGAAALSDRGWHQLAFEVFEAGVNAGNARAVRWLQEVCNAANRDERDYGDQPEDGDFGNMTLGGVQGYFDTRGDVGVIEKGVDGRQFDHYFRLSRSNPRKWESFFVGWVDRRIGTDIVLPVTNG